MQCCYKMRSPGTQQDGSSAVLGRALLKRLANTAPSHSIVVNTRVAQRNNTLRAVPCTAVGLVIAFDLGALLSFRNQGTALRAVQALACRAASAKVGALVNLQPHTVIG